MNELPRINYEINPQVKRHPVRIGRILQKRIRAFRRARLARISRLGG